MLLRANKFRKDKESDCRRNELGSRIFMGRVFGDYAECLHFYPSFSYGRIIAGQSCGVVRAPRRSHLPAVRAVLEFYERVVERGKIAPVRSQFEKSQTFQGKQRGCTKKVCRNRTNSGRCRGGRSNSALTEKSSLQVRKLASCLLKNLRFTIPNTQPKSDRSSTEII